MTTTVQIDFAELKSRISISQAVQFLRLDLKQSGPAFRGPCPTCKAGGPRALVVTPSKQVFYCFSARKGGDQLTLVAHIRDCGVRQAAEELVSAFGNGSGNGSTVTSTGNTSVASPKPPEKPKSGFDPAAYLATLDPENAALTPLGISAEAFMVWRSGYSSSGLNRGKLAIALADHTGSILAFGGWSLKDESPQMIYPRDFDPRSIVYGVDRLDTTEARLVADPIAVMQASEMGESAICFLTETVEPSQHELLAVLQHDRKFNVFY